jgi:hypothetical protein
VKESEAEEAEELLAALSAVVRETPRVKSVLTRRFKIFAVTLALKVSRERKGQEAPCRVGLLE